MLGRNPIANEAIAITILAQKLGFDISHQIALSLCQKGISVVFHSHRTPVTYSACISRDHSQFRRVLEEWTEIVKAIHADEIPASKTALHYALSSFAIGDHTRKLIGDLMRHGLITSDLANYDLKGLDETPDDSEARKILEAEIKCQFCGNHATCFGSYDNSPEDYSCDSCCGHGQEGGYCKRIVNDD